MRRTAERWLNRGQSLQFRRVLLIEDLRKYPYQSPRLLRNLVPLMQKYRVHSQTRQ